MKEIKDITEHTDVLLYLKERGLIAQYQKAKYHLLIGLPQLVDFKIRQPKSDGIWYFRINRQYRAHAYFQGEVLHVFDIDDHQ